MSEIGLWASKTVAKSIKSVEHLAFLISCASIVQSGARYIEEPVCRRLGDVADYLSLLDPKLINTIMKLLNYRAKVLEALAEFESYAMWKKQLLAVYVKKYGPGMLRFKRVRRGGDKHDTYLVFEYADSKTVVVEDANAVEQFKKYIEAKSTARATLKHYMALLRKLEEAEEPLAKKAAWLLKREALKLKRKIASLERFSTTEKRSS